MLVLELVCMICVCPFAGGVCDSVGSLGNFILQVCAMTSALYSGSRSDNRAHRLTDGIVCWVTLSFSSCSPEGRPCHA